MGIWPEVGPVAPVMISTIGAYGAGVVFAARAFGVPTGLVALPADEIRAFPVCVPEPCVVQQMAAIIGTSASGNIDLGLYDETYRLVVSTGSTAVGATSALQTIDCTDTPIGRGAYYLAVSVSASTNFHSSGPNLTAMKIAGAWEQTTGGFPLPTSPTPASATYIAYFSLALVVRQFSA